MKEQMKEHVSKHKKKYKVFVFLIIIIIIAFLVLAGLTLFSGKEKPKGKLVLSLDDKTISSGGATHLRMNVKNAGKMPISGEFSTIVDDSSSVSVSYPNTALLKFDLLPGESLERIMNVTGTSKAYKTMYKITVKVASGNTTYAAGDIILTVKGK
jgi:hypothetical protein